MKVPAGIPHPLTEDEVDRLIGLLAPLGIAPPAQPIAPRYQLPAAQDAFARCKLPLVVLDRETGFEADAVCQDHRQGVATAVDYLVSLGHRRIALFGPNPAIRPGREKLLGYRVFADGAGKMNLSLKDAGGGLLLAELRQPAGVAVQVFAVGLHSAVGNQPEFVGGIANQRPVVRDQQHGALKGLQGDGQRSRVDGDGQGESLAVAT